MSFRDWKCVEQQECDSGLAMESLIDVEDFPGRLLHQAALWDNAELLEDLLNGEELEYLDSCDSWGRSPVHAAATTESSLCLRILIQVEPPV